MIGRSMPGWRRFRRRLGWFESLGLGRTPLCPSGASPPAERGEMRRLGGIPPHRGEWKRLTGHLSEFGFELLGQAFGHSGGGGEFFDFGLSHGLE